MPEDLRARGPNRLVAEVHRGDGTALYDVTGTGSLDVVTRVRLLRDHDGAGKQWRSDPFQAARRPPVSVPQA